MIISERQRKLQQVPFVASSLLSRDLPRDTVLKHLQLRLSGNIVTTFASGTPISNAESTFDNLVSRIDIVINGSRTVKNVRPHLMAMQQLMAMGQNNERASSAGASASIYPTVDGGFQFGTTGQVSSVRESVLLSFENTMAKEGAESTWLNLKGVASAEIKFTTADPNSALLGFGNTCPLVTSSNNFVIDILTIEAQDVPPSILFSDWKQTTKELTYSAQVTESLVDINRGNLLQGIMFFTKNGAAGSATTATGKLASNNVLTDIKLILNGQTSIKVTDFYSLQAENKNRFGIFAPQASNVSRLDGIAYLDMLRKGDLSTALDVRPPEVDQVQLSLSTGTASNVSYTNPVSITVMTNEIVSPR